MGIKQFITGMGQVFTTPYFKRSNGVPWMLYSMSNFTLNGKNVSYSDFLFEVVEQFHIVVNVYSMSSTKTYFDTNIVTIQPTRRILNIFNTYFITQISIKGFYFYQLLYDHFSALTCFFKCRLHVKWIRDCMHVA